MRRGSNLNLDRAKRDFKKFFPLVLPIVHLNLYNKLYMYPMVKSNSLSDEQNKPLKQDYADS